MTRLPSSVKVIIADDHALFNDGMVRLLTSEPEYEVLATVTNGKALLQVLNSQRPDLILLDIEMPLLNGFDTTIRVRERFPRIKVVFVCMRYDNHIRQFMKLHDVDGFIIKETTAPSFKDALRRIMQGEKVSILPESWSAGEREEPQAGQAASLHRLTRTEVEIVKLIAAGLSSKMIAEKRELSTLTVEVHRKNIFRKLGAKNMADVTAFAARQGLI